MDDGSNHKKAKGTKKCVIKQKLMFENYKDCLITTYQYGTSEMMMIKQS